MFKVRPLTLWFSWTCRFSRGRIVLRSEIVVRRLATNPRPHHFVFVFFSLCSPLSTPRQSRRLLLREPDGHPAKRGVGSPAILTASTPDGHPAKGGPHRPVDRPRFIEELVLLLLLLERGGYLFYCVVCGTREDVRRNARIFIIIGWTRTDRGADARRALRLNCFFPCVVKVVEQGLTPCLARRACGDPKITRPILICEIFETVLVQAEDIVACHRGLMDFVEEGRGRARGERGSGDKTAAVPQHQRCLFCLVTSGRDGETQAAATVAVPRTSFNALYLKGGEPTRFEVGEGRHAADGRLLSIARPQHP